MKIQVDGKQVCELSLTQKRVICNDIPDSIFQEDMERRVHWVLTHKYKRCFERLRKQWEPILRERLASVPTDPDELAEVIFSQSDYKNRSQRDTQDRGRQKI